MPNGSPREVGELLSLRICNHSSVCIAELTHVFGRLAPGHPETAKIFVAISKTIGAMRPHRVREPGRLAWGTAGILAGLAFRLGGYQRGQERKLLNDALVYLQAIENGQIVLSRNIADFDILNQLVPDGRVILYERRLEPSG
nr:hypothetical protein [uncultured Rhodopila sp.]